MSEPPNPPLLDLTVGILENIRDEIRTLNTRVDSGFTELRAELGALNTRVDTLNARVDTGFAAFNTELTELRDEVVGTNRRLDSVLQIAGAHHTDLEVRVSRIETHLGLTAG